MRAILLASLFAILNWVGTNEYDYRLTWVSFCTAAGICIKEQYVFKSQQI